MKKLSVAVSTLLILISGILFFSCKKDVSESSVPVTGNTTDLVTTVSASVSGFVTDENNAPVQDAIVTAGAKTVSTNQYGYFEIKNTSLVKNAALVTISKTGYFTGIKTYAVTEGKAAFFRIKLIPKIISGSFNAASGGTVNISSGLIVSLPANAVVTASTNTAYTGTVSVASYFIDPLASDFTSIMPGDQRGIDNSGALKGLTTFGMTDVELRGASGEKLQIAPGKKATLTFPMSGVVLANAPANIPLWYLDETSGIWKEEGTAVKTGNAYIGDVSHFTCWNCDLANAIVPLTFSVVDVMGNPAGNIHVEITPLTPNSWSHIGGSTDGTGYVSVFVTPNTSYSLVLSSPDCQQQVLYTQNFSVTTTAVNLGNIAIGTTSNLYILNGSVTDCNNNPLTNGTVFVQNGFFYSAYPVSNNGIYQISYFTCTAQSVNIIALNDATLEQSPVSAHNIVAGVNNLGVIQACGSTSMEYVQYNFSGATHSFISPATYIQQYGYSTYSVIATYSQNDKLILNYDQASIAQGSSQPILGLRVGATVDSLRPNPGSQVHITEYGNIGQYIAGNFSIVAYNYTDPAITYNISCNFRTKRNY